MTFIARLSFATALAFGGLVGAPVAMAAKEKAAKPAKTAPAQISPAFRKIFAEAQAALTAKNAADLQTKLTALEPLALLPDEKYFVAVMRNELSKLTSDRAMQRRAINEIIASGSKQVSDLPGLTYAAGQTAYVAGDYKDAIAKFAEADRLGNKDINRLLLGAEANFKLSSFLPGLGLLDRAVKEEVAAGRKPPLDWFGRALSISQRAKSEPELAKWSREMVRIHPSPTTWRDALVIYRDGGKLDSQAQLDVFRLMRQTASLKGEKDFYDYAEVAVTRAIPGEAKSIIEEGFASGAVPKTSRPVGEMLTLANGKLAADKASVLADERRAVGAANGVVAANTGNAYLGYDNYPKAIEMLRLALKKGGVDSDMVNTRLGIALTKSGQKADARKAFESIGASRSAIAKFWLLYLDINP